jgi:hypothetical protein
MANRASNAAAISPFSTPIGLKTALPNTAMTEINSAFALSVILFASKTEFSDLR